TLTQVMRHSSRSLRPTLSSPPSSRTPDLQKQERDSVHGQENPQPTRAARAGRSRGKAGKIWRRRRRRREEKGQRAQEKRGGQTEALESESHRPQTPLVGRLQQQSQGGGAISLRREGGGRSPRRRSRGQAQADLLHPAH